MAAARELVINRLVARATIGGRNAVVDDKTVVVRSRLPRRNLVAVEAGDALLGVLAHLEFMDDGILVVAMAFRAFAAGAHKGGVRLLNNEGRPPGIDEASRNNQAGGDDNGNKDGAKRNRRL